MVVIALASTPVVVLLSIVIRSAAEAVPASIVTLTAEAVSIPNALIAAAIFAALPVIVPIALALTLTVVLSSSVLSAAALTEPSLTVMLKAFPVLLLRPERVVMSLLLIVAVTTPEVLLSMMLAWPTVAEPFVTVAATPAAVSMPLALIAVAISPAEPVRVPTEPAFTLTIVLPSSVFRSAALTELSPTVML